MKLRQLPSGRWLVRVSYMEDGRQREVSKTFSTKRQAEQWQAHQTTDRDTGALRRPSRLTVGAIPGPLAPRSDGRGWPDPRGLREHHPPLPRSHPGSARPSVAPTASHPRSACAGSTS